MRNFRLFQAHCARHVRSGGFSIWDVTWRGTVRLGTRPGPTAETKDSEENRTEYEPGAGVSAYQPQEERAESNARHLSIPARIWNAPL